MVRLVDVVAVHPPDLPEGGKADRKHASRHLGRVGCRAGAVKKSEVARQACCVPWRDKQPAVSAAARAAGGESAEASEPVAPRKPARSGRPWLQARSTRSTRGQEAAGGSERRRPVPPAKATRVNNDLDAGFASFDGKVAALAAETRADATRRQAPSAASPWLNTTGRHFLPQSLSLFCPPPPPLVWKRSKQSTWTGHVVCY